LDELEKLIKYTYYPMMKQLKLTLEAKCGEWDVEEKKKALNTSLVFKK
jgi:hypothetical protein